MGRQNNGVHLLVDQFLHLAALQLGFAAGVLEHQLDAQRLCRFAKRFGVGASPVAFAGVALGETDDEGLRNSPSAREEQQEQRQERADPSVRRRAPETGASACGHGP